MKSEDLIAFWRPMVDDASHSWSIGTFGAIAEFHRTADEPSERYDTPGALAIATDKGGLRLEATRNLDVIAYDTLNSDGETWSQGVVFCTRFEPQAQSIITPLGEDRDAIRDQDRTAKLFDIGVGLGLVRMCVRTADQALISELDKAAGQSLFGPSAGAVMKAFYAAQPHRVMLSPAGRAEVYQDVPQPDGEAPEGPHTHLLPKLLAKKRTHSANTPIPEGLQPVLNFHPRSPWRDSLGKRTPFNAEADKSFDALLASYALPDDRAVRASVEQAVARGLMPKDFAWPETRRGRTEARIALRRLAARSGDPRLAAWKAEYDRAPVDTDDEPADTPAH